VEENEEEEKQEQEEEEEEDLANAVQRFTRQSLMESSQTFIGYTSHHP